MEKIVPPRLEDAGLEDCALPPESIAEAFLRAASAVRLRASSLFPAAGDEEEVPECVQDPIPEDSKPNAVVDGGLLPESGFAEDLVVGEDAAVTGAPVNCVVEKGGGVVEEGKDEMVVVGGDAAERGGEKGKGCVGGGGWFKIGTEKKTSEEEGDEAADEAPGLTEGFAA